MADSVTLRTRLEIKHLEFSVIFLTLLSLFALDLHSAYLLIGVLYSYFNVAAAIQERLLDFDDRVRTQALVVACDIMKFNMKYVPLNLISEASERLRDKKVLYVALYEVLLRIYFFPDYSPTYFILCFCLIKISVRKKALQKLTEVYHDYCDKCSEGDMTINDHFEQIPCKILLLCCDKNCEEFRYHNLPTVLQLLFFL